MIQNITIVFTTPKDNKNDQLNTMSLEKDTLICRAFGIFLKTDIVIFFSSTKTLYKEK